MKEKKATQLIHDKLPTKRYEHSLRVKETALKIRNELSLDVNEEHLVIASILHDYAKYDDLSFMYQKITEFKLDNELLSYGSEVLHGPIAAVIMEHEHGITNENILNAMRYHTTGRKEMSTLEKIVFIADYIEPARDQKDVDTIRDIVFKEHKLDKAIFEITKKNMQYLIKNNSSIYKLTLECYNYYNMTN